MVSRSQSYYRLLLGKEQESRPAKKKKKKKKKVCWRERMERMRSFQENFSPSSQRFWLLCHCVLVCRHNGFFFLQNFIPLASPHSLETYFKDHLSPGGEAFPRKPSLTTLGCIRDLPVARVLSLQYWPHSSEDSFSDWTVYFFRTENTSHPSQDAFGLNSVCIWEGLSSQIHGGVWTNFLPKSVSDETWTRTWALPGDIRERAL